MNADGQLGDPFVLSEVPVAGGQLTVAQAGRPASEAEAVVLAVHGVTSSHLAWRTVARGLAARIGVCVLAPDLRGRGRSGALPPPFGMDAHVADLLAVLDAVGARRAVLAGHSMGAWVVARLAAEHPDRVTALVLVDGGLPLLPPAGVDPDELLDAVVGAAVRRLRLTFATVDDYVALWRGHPALAGAWDGDIEAYARYDLAGEAGALRCSVSEAAVRADSRELWLDGITQTAVDRVHAPVTLIRAERGLEDREPLIPGPVIAAFAAGRPHVRVEEAPGTNHYTLVMGSGPGPVQVTAAIERAAAGAPRAG